MAARHPAIAEDGPMAGDRMVEGTAERDWPEKVVWPSGRGAEVRHLYRFKEVSGGPEGVPVYTFVRTLGVDEN